METLRGMGHDTDTLWEEIGKLVTKTLVSVQPHLEHTYYTCRQRSDDAGFGCFEVLHPLSSLTTHTLSCHPRPWVGVGLPGLDVMFDHQPQPQPPPQPSPQPQPHPSPQPSPQPQPGARLRRDVRPPAAPLSDRGQPLALVHMRLAARHHRQVGRAQGKSVSGV
eukprot:scaffold39477_cov40-Phaeocystis_antarctica.AAC.1